LANGREDVVETTITKTIDDQRDTARANAERRHTRNDYYAKVFEVFGVTLESRQDQDQGTRSAAESSSFVIVLVLILLVVPRSLLVDESVVGGGPVDQLFGFEPKSDFLLRGFLRVRAVDDITTQIQAKVTTDRTRQGSLRIGFSHHHSASFGGILAFPNHRHHGTRGHEVTKTLVEGLVLEINVVLLEMLFGSLHELHGDEFEAALLESLDDIADESTLNSIRLHHDESAFGVSGHFSFGRAVCAEV